MEGALKKDRREVLQRGMKELEGDGYVHYLDDSDGFTGIYKTDQTVSIKYVSLIVCLSYRSKAVLKKNSWVNWQNLNRDCVSKKSCSITVKCLKVKKVSVLISRT